MQPTFFKRPADFRRWLQKHHASETELSVGFRKKDSGMPSITWPESVDEALCFGWIDGVRKRIDDTSYTIRFTPRKRDSTWSQVNVKRVAELEAEGRMMPAGRAAFEARTAKKTGIYAFEQTKVPELTPDQEAQFRKARKAWAFFMKQPAGYRRTATWWVISAKREETRARRLATLISDSENGLRLAQLRPS